MVLYIFFWSDKASDITSHLIFLAYAMGTLVKYQHELCEFGSFWHIIGKCSALITFQTVAAGAIL